MKKVMILGAGASQIPLIKAAKKAGHYVIVCSIPGAYPGFSLADECCYADISDPDDVLDAAKKLSIDAVTTCGMDTGIRAAGRVCDVLGLSGISEDAARRASDKSLSKEAFQKKGVNCASSFVIYNQEELLTHLEDMRLPVLVKAVDLMGSRGIYLCESREQALEAFRSVFEETKKSYCLLEEFLDGGTLFGAEGMITDGKLDFLLPYGTEVYHGCAVPTSLGHWVPFADQPLLEAVTDEVLKALDALGIRTSPFNCDLIQKDGKIYIIEINARAGASSLSETVSLYYGLDYYDVLVRHALGESVRKKFGENPFCGQPCASRMMISRRTGTVESVINPVTPGGNLVQLNLLVREGDRVKNYQCGRDRIGSILVKGDSVQSCIDLLDRTEAAISITVKEE